MQGGTERRIEQFYNRTAPTLKIIKLSRQKRKRRPAAPPKENRIVLSPEPKRRSCQDIPECDPDVEAGSPEVEEWFDEYDDLKDKEEHRKSQFAEKICITLKVHAQFEEEVFYPQAGEATQEMI
ncbi:MAG: hypothetical protein ACJ8AH_26585 [Stellaceae bacterium]